MRHRPVLALPLIALLSSAAFAAAPLKSIGEIQGTGASSPLLGEQVSVDAVLTGEFGEGMRGVFVQSLKPDRDPRTSEGLFVLLPERSPALQRGQRLRIEGRVVEIGDAGRTLTALEQTSLRVVGQAKPQPRVLSRFPANAAQWESLEGEWLRLTTPMFVAGHQGLQRSGELVLGLDRMMWTPTEKVLPGDAARAFAERNRTRLLVVDDGDLRDAPATLKILPAPPTDAAPLRVGSQVGGLQGVVDQRGAGYRLQLTQPLRVLQQDPRPAVPKVDGNLRVVAMNVLNLFNGDGLGGGFEGGRGASSAAQYERQLAKIVASLMAMNPQVVGLMEIENDGEGPQSSLAQLVEAMNAMGNGRWAFAGSTESPGSQDIKVALIYRSDLLRPIGPARYLSGGPFGPLSRPALLQTLQRIDGGPAFAVSVNHFKSKGCGRGEDQAKGADEDQRDGQSCFNAARLESSRRLLQWLPQALPREAEGRVMLIGDFNAYAMEDPMRAMYAAGYADAFVLKPGAEPPYSFIFQAQRGRLDHGLVSPALAPLLRGAAEWHTSAAEQDRFDYEQDRDDDVWRASDHDPLLLGFDL